MTRSRVEADREDLLAEAANLVERVELGIPGTTTPVTIGRNRQGHWSFYFGSEPMVRFDGAGGLRRAVREGKLYRTQGHTLAELTRVRLDEETQLRRRDLDSVEIHNLLETIRVELTNLSEALSQGAVQVLRQVGAESDFLNELSLFLRAVTSKSLTLAAALPTRRY